MSGQDGIIVPALFCPFRINLLPFKENVHIAFLLSPLTYVKNKKLLPIVLNVFHVYNLSSSLPKR